MNRRNLIVAAALAIPLVSFAADETAPYSRRIELKDGTYIIIDADGTMSHYDSRRQPMKMAPGKLMEGKDGTVYEMRNNALWQRLWLRGTLRDPK
ncbi:CopK family periplasmic copper-binding protein [Herbaspirillum sp. ST 5-3]|uniref:CopK family periplasmic copper-binding protein n=1 Tax=Oxalobacteraceae TaxID=75682 RepID=UPI0010A50D89|nr:CopK family periplasmic copper-binding protein [Herbaspirillum sp. ST 5-3]